MIFTVQPKYMESGIFFKPGTTSFHFHQVFGKFLSFVVNVILQVDFFFPFNGIFWMFNFSEILELL